MATHTVTTTNVGTPAFTLTANVVDTVTFDDHPNLDAPRVQIISDGAAEVWYTTDGSTPTVGGAHCYYLPAAPCIDDDIRPNSAGATVVKLISTGTPKIRVQRTKGA